MAVGFCDGPITSFLSRTGLVATTRNGYPETWLQVRWRGVYGRVEVLTISEQVLQLALS